MSFPNPLNAPKYIDSLFGPFHTFADLKPHFAVLGISSTAFGTSFYFTKDTSLSLMIALMLLVFLFIAKSTTIYKQCGIQNDGSVQLQELLDRMTPNNKDIQKTIIDIGEAVNVMNKLPATAKTTLTKVLDTEIHKKNYGALYLNYAIKFQLDDFVKHIHNTNFTFIRDSLCFDESNEEIKKKLDDDLRVLLSLVNGKLKSIMYKDIYAWEEKEYFLENHNLVKNGNKSRSLARLIIYENKWLDTKAEEFEGLYNAATWHSMSEYSKYKVAFLSIDEIDEKEKNMIFGKPPQGVDLLASCLLNDTRIYMYQDGDRSNLKRFIYKANSDEKLVEKYDGIFNVLFTRANNEYENEVSSESTKLFVNKILDLDSDGKYKKRFSEKMKNLFTEDTIH